MDLLNVTVTLFLIMDPMGNIPIFLTVLDRVPAARRRRIIARELLLALAVIVIFILLGGALMSLLGLRPESVSIAGGIILFLIAVRMIFPVPHGWADESDEGEPLLVPLAVPLVAGPSLLAVLLILATAHRGQLPALLLAAGIAWAGTFALIYSSTFLLKLLTRRGLVAMERLMGMILVAMAVQLFLEGLAGAMPR